MNLFYEMLPTSVSVGGEEIEIVTDFREIIRLIDMMKEDIEEQDKLACICQYFIEFPSDLQTAISELIAFIAMDIEETEQIEGVHQSKDVFSFSIDFPYIYSGFLQTYGIDLIDVEYLHWWKFKMLFSGLPENTEIKQRMYYRGVNISEIKDNTERARIRRIQESIKLPVSKRIVSDYDIGDCF